MTAADSTAPTAPTARAVDLWRHLATLITGGALVSFAGSALTFIYFWKLGGVPVGQAAGTGAMAKAVLSSTFMLGGLLLMGWLSPTILFQIFSDEGSFSQRVRQIFSISDSGSGESINFKNIAYFGASTVGIGCLSLTMVAFGIGLDENNEWTWKSYTFCLIAPFFLIGYFLTFKWCSFNKEFDKDHKGEAYPDPKKKNYDLLAWLFVGYFSAVVATFPLLTMLIIFLKTDFLLEQDSYTALGAGSLVISLAILLAYCVSLAALVQRSKGRVVQWSIILGVNACTLLFVVMMFGIGSKMLDAVMEMSSVRVERAIMVLEPEGCELLRSMQATGVRNIGGDSKACVLYDVTIQSTLEPAMQVACMRGSAYDKDKKVNKTEVVSGIPYAEIMGKPGVFSIPTKYVRSVWKTSGVKYENKDNVCPVIMPIIIN